MTRDPGLQPERTLLAWRRTSLGLVANGVLLLATGYGTSPVRFGLGIGVIALALTCWAVIGAVYRRATTQPPGALGHRSLLRAATGLVVVIGVVDLYAVVTR